MEVVGRIVLTGGPCAGKTTALAKIEKDLTEQGYKVLIVSESATELIKGGIRTFGDMPINNVVFQSLILDYQLAKEKTYDEAAMSISEKCVIIYDRGVLDNKAYIDHKTFRKLLKEKGLSELKLLDKYDMVLHLVTAADGKPEHYTLDNNVARSDSINEAIELDYKTANAWLGHNNLKIIDNETDFEEKMNRVLSEINNFLNPTKRVRVQKKYIVDLKNTDLDFLDEETSTRIDITQTYMKSGKDMYERRIRERNNGLDVTHFMTVQKKKEKGVSNILLDKKISEKDYNILISSEEDIKTINKTRISFVYKKNVFRLDIYENGLVILELDVTNDGKKVALPEYIDVIEDVTEKEAFRAYALANLDNDALKLLLSYHA